MSDVDGLQRARTGTPVHIYTWTGDPQPSQIWTGTPASQMWTGTPVHTYTWTGDQDLKKGEDELCDQDRS